MILPPGFQFSQGSLQDFVDCPRRFYLRYIQQQAWPAIESEPVLQNERYMQQGARFHRMVQQHLLGVPAERLSAMAAGDDLALWWENFLGAKPSLLGSLDDPGTFWRAEIALSAPLAGFRLIAKFDLVVIKRAGQAVIFDWKTSKKRAPRAWLAKRLQTRVYPYLLVVAGAQLNDHNPLKPEQVELVYWFASHPDRPERFTYDRASFEADGVYLQELAATGCGAVSFDQRGTALPVLRLPLAMQARGSGRRAGRRALSAGQQRRRSGIRPGF